MKSTDDVQQMAADVLDKILAGSIDPVKAAALSSMMKRYQAATDQKIAIARNKSALESAGVDWQALLGTKPTA